MTTGKLSSDDYQIVQYVVDHLGATLTARLAGATSSDVGAWLDSRDAPAEDQLQRVKFARKIFKQISRPEIHEPAPNWLTRRHIEPDMVSPATAIAHDRFRDVRRAAKHLSAKS